MLGPVEPEEVGVFKVIDMEEILQRGVGNEEEGETMAAIMLDDSIIRCIIHAKIVP